MFQQQRAASAAQLSHDGRGGQAVAHTVAHDQGDAPVIEVEQVVPVAADLQGSGGGLVSHRESLGQFRRAQDGVL